MQLTTVLRPVPAIQVMGMVLLLAVYGAVHAEPLLQSDTSQENTPAPTVDLRDELAPLSNTDPLESGPNAASPHPAPAPATATLPPEWKTPVATSDNGPTLHSTLKEAVRPLYQELQESGAVDTWRELKSDLGLSKNNWERETHDDKVPISGDQPDPVHSAGWQSPTTPPKSAAQAQLDREYDAFLLQQLIDDVKPWVFGLIGVYALGYLAKLVFNFLQWKAARRRERRLRVARHRMPRRSQSSKQEH